MLHLGMVALIDALLTYAPPERMVEIDWPDTIRVDGGLVGGGRIAWPKDAREDEPPAWMVFGGMIRTVSMSDAEPGLNPLSAALEEEGFTDLTAAALVESFARHLMVHSDAWQEYGFAAVAKEYVNLLPRDKGVRRDIDEDGDLLVRRMGKVEVERRKLAPLLATPSWLDPKTRGPK
jgi:biotin-(acetyl-CoA carboxylase) ligase